MPIGRRRDNHMPARFIKAHLPQGFRLALLHHGCFNHLPVTIERIELQGNPLRFIRIRCQQ